MVNTQRSGLLLATGIVAGAVALIALDFAGTDGLQRLWSGIVGFADAVSVEARLRSTGVVDQFVDVDVPELGLRVETGTSYITPRALAAREPMQHWCVVKRETKGMPFTPAVELAHQCAGEAPVFAEASTVTADQARLFAASAEDLVTVAHKYCRFD